MNTSILTRILNLYCIVGFLAWIAWSDNLRAASPGEPEPGFRSILSSPSGEQIGDLGVPWDLEQMLSLLEFRDRDSGGDRLPGLRLGALDGVWSGRMSAPAVLHTGGLKEAPIALELLGLDAENGTGIWALGNGAIFTIGYPSQGTLVFSLLPDNVISMALMVPDLPVRLLMIGTVSDDLERIVGALFYWVDHEVGAVPVGAFRLGRQ
jgi:hypothetical protein